MPGEGNDGSVAGTVTPDRWDDLVALFETSPVMSSCRCRQPSPAGGRVQPVRHRGAPPEPGGDARPGPGRPQAGAAGLRRGAARGAQPRLGQSHLGSGSGLKT
jgi:hypothetical protein